MADEQNKGFQFSMNGNQSNLSPEQVEKLLASISQSLSSIPNIVGESVSNVLGGLKNNFPADFNQFRNFIPTFETVNEDGRLEMRLNGETLFELELSPFKKTNS